MFFRIFIVSFCLLGEVVFLIFFSFFMNGLNREIFFIGVDLISVLSVRRVLKCILLFLRYFKRWDRIIFVVFLFQIFEKQQLKNFSEGIIFFLFFDRYYLRNWFIILLLQGVFGVIVVSVLMVLRCIYLFLEEVIFINGLIVGFRMNVFVLLSFLVSFESVQRVFIFLNLFFFF